MTAQNIESEFQSYIKAVFGDKMLDKGQMTELRLAFAAGMTISHNAIITALEDPSEDPKNFFSIPEAIREYALETNANR